MIKFTVGITGGSGVGKTTLINLIKQELGDTITVFNLDNYYLPKDQQVRDENGVINFDLPSALDTERIKNDLQKLRNGESIEQEVYVFNNPNKDRKKITLEPSSILIIEGLFVMHYDFVREQLDYSVYISAPQDLQLRRRLKRDMEERNYTKEDILYQWNKHVLPSYESFLLPYKEKADLIINNAEEFDSNVKVLLNVIHNCTQLQEN